MPLYSSTEAANTKATGPGFKGGNSLQKAAQRDLQQRVSQDQQQLADTRVGWRIEKKKRLKQN